MVKYNTDGFTYDTTNIFGGGGILSDYNSVILICFSFFCNLLFLLNYLQLAIEIAHGKDWYKFWLECESFLVEHCFSHPSLVHTCIKTRRNNCINFTQWMTFIIYHIYKEENMCEGKLGFFGVSFYSFFGYILPSVLLDAIYWFLILFDKFCS